MRGVGGGASARHSAGVGFARTCGTFASARCVRVCESACPMRARCARACVDPLTTVCARLCAAVCVCVRARTCAFVCIHVCARASSVPSHTVPLPYATLRILCAHHPSVHCSADPVSAAAACAESPATRRCARARISAARSPKQKPGRTAAQVTCEAMRRAQQPTLRVRSAPPPARAAAQLRGAARAAVRRRRLGR